ncbi:MAG: transporter substrate-binding domain-containing protein [Devosiaceae bacterium]|nr:transporter substrate-binding domain-containing protein [Devosiaceae bacterium MH13]
MTFHRFAVAALATFGLAAGTASVSAQDTVRIGTEGAYPPYNFTDSDGNLVGFEIDLANAICEEAGVTCEFVAQDWDGIIPALLASRYDAIMAGMSITEERMEVVDFTRMYFTTPARFIAAKDSGLTETTPEALAGLTIGAQSATIHANFLEDLYGDSDIRPYPTQDEVNLDLAAGRIDLLLADSSATADWLETDDGSCCMYLPGDYTDPEYFGNGVGIALRQEDDELRETLNAAITALEADGTIDALAAEWFPFLANE